MEFRSPGAVVTGGRKDAFPREGAPKRVARHEEESSVTAPVLTIAHGGVDITVEKIDPERPVATGRSRRRRHMTVHGLSRNEVVTQTMDERRYIGRDSSFVHVSSKDAVGEG
jgi:hypothetical protein